MKELTSEGVGVEKQSAQPLTKEMEEILWDKEIFTPETGIGLRNITFWYNYKLFGLQACDEHRNLEVSQYEIGEDEIGTYLRFKGRSSKNYQGGLQHRRVIPKDLRIYAKPELGDRCVVGCFQLYLSLIPKEGGFYRRALYGSLPRFSSQLVGIHTLEKIVPEFCKQAGFI